MRRPKKLLVSVTGIMLCAAGVATSGVAAAGVEHSSAASSIKANISIWGWPGSMTPFQDSMGNFHKLYPGISVTYDVASWSTTQTKLATAIASGSGAPDISWVDGSQIQHFVQVGGLTNVTSAVGSLKSDFPSFKLDLAENSSGQLFAWPGDMGPVMLWYNSKIFAKYNLPVPTTWTQYIQDGTVLKSHGIYMLDLAKSYLTNEYQPNTSIFQFLLQEAGGSLYNAQGKSTIDSPQGREAMTIFEDMYKAGIGANINRWTPAEWDAYKSGTVATIVDAAWMLNDFPVYITTAAEGLGDWRVAPMPRINASQPGGATDGGSYLVVPAQITGTQRQASMDFIKFMDTNTQALLQWAKFGLIPSYLPVYKNPALLKTPHPEFGTENVIPVIEQASTYVKGGVYLEPAAYRQATNYIDGTIGPVASGSNKESISAYLSATAAQLTAFQLAYSS